MAAVLCLWRPVSSQEQHALMHVGIGLMWNDHAKSDGLCPTIPNVCVTLLAGVQLYLEGLVLAKSAPSVTSNENYKCKPDAAIPVHH